MLLCFFLLGKMEERDKLREELLNEMEPGLGDLGNPQLLQRQKTLNLRNGPKPYHKCKV